MGPLPEAEVLLFNNQSLPLDFEKLMLWTCESLPTDQLKNGFVAAQRKSLSLKSKQALFEVLGFSSAAAAAAGLNPFPLVDAALIMPIQISMSIRLAYIYGFDSLSDNIMSLVKSQIISMLGKMLASSLLKLIPVLGQIVNAGVAGSITGGLGITLNTIYYNAYKQWTETGKLPDWSLLFTAEYFDKAFREGMNKWKENK